jgi:hypothetical protein
MFPIILLLPLLPHMVRGVWSAHLQIVVDVRQILDDPAWKFCENLFFNFKIELFARKFENYYLWSQSWNSDAYRSIIVIVCNNSTYYNPIDTIELISTIINSNTASAFKFLESLTGDKKRAHGGRTTVVFGSEIVSESTLILTETL